eukprot:Skav225317  [mRNA]  locus=scaffold891:89021:103940:- [translate_table: standard]
MRLAPVPLGNADPEWQPRPETEAEAYNGGSRRRCVWAMMLISILLILHVQRDRYIEALRWHGGIADHGPPLPWEVQPIILPNDTYEASFLAPSLRRASSFVKLSSDILAVNGMSSSIFTNSSRTSESDKSITMVIGSGTLDCKEATMPCFVAVQQSGSSSSDENCYHFATGAAFGDLKTRGKDLCLRTGCRSIESKQVYAALATKATANHSEVVLAWDPKHGESSRPHSCLARVTFPDMQLLSSLAVDLVASVIYDHAAQRHFEEALAEEGVGVSSSLKCKAVDFL